MTSLLLTQKEIFDELRLIDAERQKTADTRAWISNERAKLQAMENELLVTEKDFMKRDKELRGQLQKMITDSELAPISLTFYEEERTLCWDGGSVKLGTNPFKIVKALYDSPNRRARMTRLAKQVWGLSSKHHSTVKSTISRLNVELKKANCPYKIVGAKCPQPKVIYNRNPATNKINVKECTLLPEITGFKLVVRK